MSAQFQTRLCDCRTLRADQDTQTGRKLGLIVRDRISVSLEVHKQVAMRQEHGRVLPRERPLASSNENVTLDLRCRSVDAKGRSECL